MTIRNPKNSPGGDMAGWTGSPSTGRQVKWTLWGRRGKKAVDERSRSSMRFDAVDVDVPVALDLLSPTMKLAVIEDVCWAAGREAWLAHKPRFWQRKARHEWHVEGEQLDAKRQRVATPVKQGMGRS